MIANAHLPQKSWLSLFTQGRSAMLRLINLSCVFFVTFEDVVGPVLDIHPLTHSQQAALGSFSIELGILLIGKKLFKTAERSGY